MELSDIYVFIVPWSEEMTAYQARMSKICLGRKGGTLVDSSGTLNIGSVNTAIVKIGLEQ